MSSTLKSRYMECLYSLYKHPKQALEIQKQLQQNLVEQNCLLGENALPISLMPILYSKEEAKKLHTVSEIAANIIHKTITASLSSPKLREYCEDCVPREWIAADLEDMQTSVMRFDLSFNGKDLKILGLNCDMRGISWADQICRQMANHPFYENIVTFPSHEQNQNTLQAFFDFVHKTYQKICDKGLDSAGVAFVDYRESAYVSELNLCSNFFSERNIHSFVADPRDFSLADNCAYVDGRKVDVVIRGPEAQELLKFSSQLKSFHDAYAAKAFVMFNPFRSTYGSEKSLLSLITNPDFYHLYENYEIEIIQKHFLWTRRLSELETNDQKGQKINLQQYLLENRDKVILKPSSGYQRGQSIIGPMIFDEEWPKMIKQYLGRKDWVAQEYFSLPHIVSPAIKGKRIAIEDRFFNVCAFVLGNQFQSAVARSSKEHIININTGNLVPIFEYDSKNSYKRRRYLK